MSSREMLPVDSTGSGEAVRSDTWGGKGGGVEGWSIKLPVASTGNGEAVRSDTWGGKGG